MTESTDRPSASTSADQPRVSDRTDSDVLTEPVRPSSGRLRRPMRTEAELQPALDRRFRTGTWRYLIEQRATALELSLARVDYESDSIANTEEVATELRQYIRKARRIATTRRTWVRRIADSWTGSQFELASSLLDRVSEGLLLVQPSSAVAAQLPNLRAGLKARLRVTDPRFDFFIRVLDNLERQMGLIDGKK
jgi:hypothetical protein